MHSSLTLSIDLSLLAKSRMGKCDTQNLRSSSLYFEFSLYLSNKRGSYGKTTPPGRFWFSMRVMCWVVHLPSNDFDLLKTLI